MKRFLEKVQWNPNGCWEWLACLNSDGYGSFWLDGRMRGAHRVSYERYIGPIPANTELDHLCRVRHCVNPFHLEPVSHKLNVRRGGLASMRRSATKPACVAGHLLSGDNLAVWAGNRYCRECDRRRSREYKERQRESI